MSEDRGDERSHETLGADEVTSIALGVRNRDRFAVARALNLLEDRRSGMRGARRDLLLALKDAQRGHVIGVTGPPGAGKSTLCAALARALRRRGDAVGIVAVDPSSKRSGGALLGDRVRIVGDVPDPGLFVRSLAAGGELGGLSRSAPACIELLAAASDVVMVETVGVGQSEIDVEHVADVTVVLVQPASGDTLQFFKAGVLEIPDVLVVSKSDLGEVALRAESDLRHALHTAAQVGAEATLAPVMRVSGETGEGVAELLSTIDARLSTLRTTGELAARRRRGGVERGLTSIARSIGELGIGSLGGIDVVRERLLHLIDGGAPSIACAEAMVDEGLAALRRG